MILRSGLLLLLNFAQCNKGKGDERDDKLAKDTGGVDDNSGDNRPDSNDPVDLMILFFLVFCAITFLYFFIRYLLRKRSEILASDNKSSRNTRRHRFGRIRKNSGSKPWLYPLDPLPKVETDPPVDDHDADKFIQSDISPETVLRQQDPFGVSEIDKDSWLGWMDYIGIVTAAFLSFLLIFILSNIEEQ
jgi:hypothetical protein